MERLQKIIAQAGICSRRAAEDLIKKGRVRVNGRVVTELGSKADPRRDKIEVDNKRIEAENLLYVVLHKPRGYVSTLEDPEGRPTVRDLISDIPERLHPVGRLDFATSGVLLMTNDGELTHRLLHPSTKARKTYVVKLDKVIDDVELEAWRNGIELEDGTTLPAEARRIRNEKGKSWLEVTLHEGRNHQLRRMAAAQGFVAMRLARLSFAGIESADLRPGQWRPLTVDELRKLKRTHGVPKRVRPQMSLFSLLKKVEEKRAAAKKRKRAGPKKGTAAQRPKGGAALKHEKQSRENPSPEKPHRERPSPEKPRRERPSRDKQGRDKQGRDKQGRDKQAPPGKASRRGDATAERSDRTGKKPPAAGRRGPRDRGRGRR